MDRLEAMTMLLEVVDKGNLSAASRALQVPLPTLSRKISELESLLATRLLIRTTRKITLTDAGLIYVEAARRILEQVGDAEREAAGEFATPKGELIVTAPVMFGRIHVLPIVEDFLSLYPEISIRLNLVDRNMHLVDDRVDMAVRIGALPDSSMSATQVGSTRTIVCASPHLLASHGTPKSPQDLMNFPCVTVDPVPTLGWRFLSGSAATINEIPIKPRLAVTTTEAAVEAAIHGIGVTRLLHYQVAGAVASGTLNIILESFEPPPSPVHLVHVGRRQMPIKIRKFIDFSIPRLKSALQKLSSPASQE